MDNYSGLTGKVLDGRYRILEYVGSGGMAVVLKAEDLVMNRVVAIKILNDRYNGDEQAEKRFINESKAVAMLSNKNIVSVYDVAIYPDIKYIVMEYLDGITLREYMDNKKILPWKEACVYTLQILRALEHAHGKDVIHRDIKPQNIILLKSGEVKVTDFGIAKTPNMADASVADKAIGTVYYISPEQAAGIETTSASDLYSVGVMLYEQITGELPFVADSAVTVAMMQINDTPRDPRELNPDIPVGVAQIVMKSMNKQAQKRFTDAHTMLKAVDYVIKHPDVVFCDGESEKYNDNYGGDDKPEKENEYSEEFPEDESETAEQVDINMISTGEIGDYVINVSENAAEEPQVKDKKQIRSEKRKARKQRRAERPSHSVFPVVTGVFFAFMIVALAVGGYLAFKWVPTLFTTEKPKDFMVRDLIDLEYTTELKSELEEQGYIITVTEVYRQGLGFNKIVNQDPTMGNKRTADGKCRINLLVNRYPDELVVPDVRYMTGIEAEKILKQYSLYAVTEYRADAYANEKQVISTSPEIGTRIKAGSTVTLYICEGTGITDAKAMPKTVGLDIAAAQKLLRDSYYLVTVSYVSSDKPQGQVLTQSIPEFTGGLTAWTMVTLEVSNYTEMVAVENYFGMTLEAAKTRITAAGFKLGSVTYMKSIYMADTVIGQGVPYGTHAASGTAINLTISGEGINIASPVPGVTGKNVEIAKQLLEHSGYTVAIVKRPDAGTPDTVLRQSIAEGATGYPSGTSVTLTVSVSMDSVLIGDCSGYTFPELLLYLDSNGLVLGTVSFSTEAIEGTEEYTVIAQSREANEYVAPGTSMDVTLFGSQRFASPVPRTDGMTEAGAVRALREAWYNVKVVYEVALNTDGIVLRQSIDPEKDDCLPGTEITITVCIEKTTTTVPSLLDLTFDEAVDLLYSLDLTFNVDFRESTKPDNTVIEQSIAEGEEVPFGTKIDIILSTHIDQ